LVDIHRLDFLWRVCCLLLWSSVEIWLQTPTTSRKTGSKDSVFSPFVSISETLLKLDPLTQICRALSMSYITEYVFDYGQLESSFVCALKHWKPQTVSFLELPPEIRNMIYNLLVNETKDRNPRLLDFEPGSLFAAPSLNMLHTCTQVQQKLLPLYFPSSPHISACRLGTVYVHARWIMRSKLRLLSGWTERDRRCGLLPCFSSKVF
jgi:hypothetical protein